MNTTKSILNVDALDDAIVVMQALEILLHELPSGPQTTALHVLGASVTNALTSVQFSLTNNASNEGEAG